MLNKTSIVKRGYSFLRLWGEALDSQVDEIVFGLGVAVPVHSDNAHVTPVLIRCKGRKKKNKYFSDSGHHLNFVIEPLITEGQGEVYKRQLLKDWKKIQKSLKAPKSKNLMSSKKISKLVLYFNHYCTYLLQTPSIYLLSLVDLKY